jgi:predicted AAA+ superfamily ATPase
VPRLGPFLEGKEAVVLTGPRRAGKTTVMFQLMDQLEAKGVAATAMLHLNLEEPGLAGLDGLKTLEEAYRTFRRRVHPKGRAWLFLDEVQSVPGWERWVRARMESEDLKVFLTGSSSAMMSRELGTLMTGRQVSFQVWPLSFREFLAFKGLTPPKRPGLVPDDPTMQHALLEYLRWGGFPEVALSDSDERREKLLKQYFDDVLFKDVALRHGIRDLTMLRALAVALLQETASLTSITRLAARLASSQDLVRSYCAFLQEAYLVAFLPFHSPQLAERQRRPQKVHALDTGLRNAVCLSPTSDWGRLAETALWAHLARDADLELHYWKGKHELDLLALKAGRPKRLFQVTWQAESPTTQRREAAALAEAQATFPKAKPTLIHGPGPAPTVPEGAEARGLWVELVEG